MTEFLTENTSLPPYMVFPRFLLDMELNETTKLLYMVLLDRARLSLKNEGRMDRYIRSCVPLLYHRSNGGGSPQKPDDHQNIPDRTGKAGSDSPETSGSRSSQPDLCEIPGRGFLPDRQDSFPKTDRKLSC